jgi:alkyl hydroperoxide reductase subunit F
MPELIVAGGGPAGLTAALYCVRRRREVLLVSPELGGKTRMRPAIHGAEDYRVIRGGELVSRFARELEYLDYPVRRGRVERVALDGDRFRVRVAGGDAAAPAGSVPGPAGEGEPAGEELTADAVILATGSRSRPLGVPGEEGLFLKGLYGSAVSYAHLFLDKGVLVVGDGRRARDAAVELSAAGAQVSLLLVGAGPAGAAAASRAGAARGVQLLEGHGLRGLRRGPGAGGAVEALLSTPGGGEQVLRVEGVFNEMEPLPESGPVAGLAELDAAGRVLVDARCRTSRQGLFAAGDVTDVHREQILVAVGEGAKAALSALEYLEGR